MTLIQKCLSLCNFIFKDPESIWSHDLSVTKWIPSFWATSSLTHTVIRCRFQTHENKHNVCPATFSQHYLHSVWSKTTRENPSLRNRAVLAADELRSSVHSDTLRLFSQRSSFIRELTVQRDEREAEETKKSSDSTVDDIKSQQAFNCELCDVWFACFYTAALFWPALTQPVKYT